MRQKLSEEIKAAADRAASRKDWPRNGDRWNSLSDALYASYLKAKQIEADEAPEGD